MTSTGLDAVEHKQLRNERVQRRYDELMLSGKHGHYETLFRIVREECELAYEAGCNAMRFMGRNEDHDG